MTWEPNTKLFDEMNKPFASMEEADDSIKKFLEGVGKLREECKIANYLMVLGCSVEAEDGPQEFFSLSQAGDGLKGETLAAYALGHMAKERQERLGALIAGRGTKSRK